MRTGIVVDCGPKGRSGLLGLNVDFLHGTRDPRRGRNPKANRQRQRTNTESLP